MCPYECMEINSEIGARIKERREAMAMSVSDFAKKIGVSKQKMLDFENGKGEIPASTIYLSSVVLNVPVEYFFVESVSEHFAIRIEELKKLFALIEDATRREETFELCRRIAFAANDC